MSAGKYGKYLPNRVPAAHYCRQPLLSYFRRTNLWQCGTCEQQFEYRTDPYGKARHWYPVGVTDSKFQVEWTKQLKELSKQTWVLVCERCNCVEKANPIDAYHRGWRLAPWIKNARVTCGNCPPRRWLWWLIVEVVMERQ